MKTITQLDDPRLVKGLAHPLRMRILGILENKVASPKTLAAEIPDTNLESVSYHVRVLQKYGLIELVRRTPRRGSVEHHYRAVGRLRISDEAWASAPIRVREAFVHAIIGQVSDFVNAAVSEGGFDRGDAHASRTPMTLDEKGFGELAKELDKLLATAGRIQKDSEKRLRRNGHEGEIPVGLVLLQFEAADFGSAGSSEQPGSRRRAPRRRVTAKR